MKHVVVGTAGHIDHGKTALVKALTGIDCDRLPEERERGITIDLGFAYLSPAPDLRFGIVDVPGHERFVKNMVAGTGGIDLVALVVAADEGVMPQTREHLDICRLLGLPRGLVVITKVDLVEADWLAMVREDVRAFVAGTFLEGAPVVEFSAVDGRGLDEVRAALELLARGVPPRPEGGAPRLPVDRVFVLAGFGTVVTGTLISGQIRPGDALEAVPGGARGRVRGLQAYGAEVAQATAGMRTAVNLQGVERVVLGRGDVLTHPGALDATTRIDVDLTYLEHARRPLRDRAQALFHVGTAHATARVLLLDRAQLEPGETAPAQLRIDRPIAAMPGDRFILRGFEALEHHGTTVGGGVVLDAHAPRQRRGDPEALRSLEVLRGGAPAERIEALLRRAGASGLDPAEIGRRLPLSGSEIERALGDLLSRGRAVRFDRERGACVHGEVAAALRERLCDAVRAYHAQHPERPGIPKEELRARMALDPKLFHLLLGQLQDRLAAEQDTVRELSHRAALSGGARDLEERVRAAFRGAALQPPWPRELAAQLNVTEAEMKRVVQFLASRGEIVRVSEDLYFDRAALDALEQRLAAHLEVAGSITTQEFKEMTGLTRKYLIPLQEHFDAAKLTLRVGDKRVLRRAAGTSG
jgi:selenocysteine-specific elongation factor